MERISRDRDRAREQDRLTGHVRPGRSGTSQAHGVGRDLPSSTTPVLRILLISSRSDVQDRLREYYEGAGHEVLLATRSAGVVEMIARAEVDVVLCDPELSDGSAQEVLDAVSRQHPRVTTALLTEMGASIDLLSDLGRQTPPVPTESPDESQTTMAGSPAAGSPATVFRGMYGSTAVMADVFRMIARVGRTDVTVLVTGESGTGKELVARALHDESSRRNKPFVALNCSALPSELVESELFGHTRGAFTGAVKDRGGLFEAANGGTLFLDESGDLGPLAQAKVLRALENGEVMRVGGTRSTRVDVRVIAATNRPLDVMVHDGRFREDLLYRLKVISLALPPLRDRKPDIALLADHFLEVFSDRHRLTPRQLTAAARDILLAYDWPGNVRELRNVIEGALVMCDGPEIDVCDLPAAVTRGSEGDVPSLLTPSVMDQTAALPFVEARERALREFDRAFLGAALTRNGGNIARTARALGLHRQSLQKLLARRDLRQQGEGAREL
jgi:DNA-binding NtrC family response regulator